MVKYPFHGQQGTVRYNTGQGIGIYSSWTSIAVTHHLLILLAAYRVNQQNFQDYAVLGDDVVIADEKVASRYKSLILSLGLEISSTKTISPHGDMVPIEFASKLVLNGVDLSPLPIGLLQEGGFQGYLYLWTTLFQVAVQLDEVVHY